MNHIVYGGPQKVIDGKGKRTFIEKKKKNGLVYGRIGGKTEPHQYTNPIRITFYIPLHHTR